MKDAPTTPKDRVTIGEDYKKPPDAPYYAQKSTGDFLPETLKEFPNLKNNKDRGTVHRGGYFMPTEDKEYLRSRERELKSELKNIEKETNKLTSNRSADNAKTLLAEGVGATSALLGIGSAIYALSGSAGAIAATIGSGIAFIGSCIALDNITWKQHYERCDFGKYEDRLENLENTYYQDRAELDHVKKSEIFWPNRELSPREKCESEFKKIRSKAINNLALTYSADYYDDNYAGTPYGGSTSSDMVSYNHGRNSAIETVDGHYKKKYPEFYNDEIKHSEEYYEKLLPKIMAEKW